MCVCVCVCVCLYVCMCESGVYVCIILTVVGDRLDVKNRLLSNSVRKNVGLIENVHEQPFSFSFLPPPHFSHPLSSHLLYPLVRSLSRCSLLFSHPLLSSSLIRSSSPSRLVLHSPHPLLFLSSSPPPLSSCSPHLSSSPSNSFL